MDDIGNPSDAINDMRARAPIRWRDILPVHPAADMLPRLSVEALMELGRSIRDLGMLHPVVILRDPAANTLSLLDGISRLDSLTAVGIELRSQNNRRSRLSSKLPISSTASRRRSRSQSIASIRSHLSAPRTSIVATSTGFRSASSSPSCSPPARPSRIEKLADWPELTARPLQRSAAPNAETPHSERVEASGRKARGQKPKTTAAPAPQRAVETPEPTKPTENIEPANDDDAAEIKPIDIEKIGELARAALALTAHITASTLESIQSKLQAIVELTSAPKPKPTACSLDQSLLAKALAISPGSDPGGHRCRIS